ncbi:MAG TPA: PilZ domain-containing protein [Candidatus Omnitrophota bacterium]|nr:PilZ domain-containing protein [Candidatus Omnitrophota bacterium]HQL40898.1 PilZ domain-containing protein [Candidatus Omnitrophota bacterium]
MIEKRRFFRFPFSLKTIFFTFEDGSAAEVCLDNISRGGVGFHSSHQAFQQGAVVRVRLQLEPSQEAIMFTGKVAWVCLKEKLGKAGIEITQIDPAQKSELLEKAYKTWLSEESKKQKGCA